LLELGLQEQQLQDYMRIGRQRRIMKKKMKKKQRGLGKSDEEAGLEPDLQVHILTQELTQS